MGFLMTKTHISVKVFTLCLCIIIAVGVWLRITWIYQCDRGTNWLPDEYYYFVSMAENAFSGKGFYPAFNDNFELNQGGVLVPPPMQAFFLYVIYKIAGKITDPIIPRLVQALLGGIMILAGGLIGFLFNLPVAGLIIALLFAIYPEFVFHTEILQVESNYLSGLTMLLLFLSYWIKTKSAWWAFFSAFMVGCLTLQRSISLGLPVFLFLLALYSVKKKSAIHLLIFLCVPFCVIVPWFVRNLVVYREPILVGSVEGIAFYVSNNRKLDPLKVPYAFFEILTNKNYNVFVPHIEKQYRRPDGKKFATNNEGTLLVSWYKYSEAYKKEALTYIKHHPMHFFKNIALKTWNQFWLVQDLPKKAVRCFDNKLTFWILHRILLLGGFLGFFIVLAWHRKKEYLPVITLFIYYAVILSLSTLDPSGRYNIYLKLFLIIFFACGCNLVLLRFTERRYSCRNENDAMIQ